MCRQVPEADAGSLSTAYESFRACEPGVELPYIFNRSYIRNKPSNIKKRTGEQAQPTVTCLGSELQSNLVNLDLSVIRTLLVRSNVTCTIQTTRSSGWVQVLVRDSSECARAGMVSGLPSEWEYVNGMVRN